MKKIRYFFLCMIWMVCIGALYLFLTSFCTWKSMNGLLKSAPFLIIGVLAIVLGFVTVICFRKKKVFLSITSFLLVFSAIVTSVFYFPFILPHSLTSFEKTIENQFILKNVSKKEKNGTWEGEKVVAHSMGTVDGNAYAPSVETFIESYKKGYRAMEVDFVYTSDHFLVCRHLWEDPDLQEGIDSEHIPSLEQFEKTKILGEYTPLSFARLCELLKEYPDVWIVTDTKDQSLDQVRQHFCSIVSEAQENDALEVLDRFVIQSYTSNMIEEIQEIYPFKNHIYASYEYWNGNIVDFVKICRWCNNLNVDSISMWDIYYCPNIQYIADRYGLDIYVHTINSIQRGQECLDMGAKGIYSDLVLPSDLS